MNAILCMYDNIALMHYGVMSFQVSSLLDYTTTAGSWDDAFHWQSSFTAMHLTSVDTLHITLMYTVWSLHCTKLLALNFTCTASKELANAI